MLRKLRSAIKSAVCLIALSACSNSCNEEYVSALELDAPRLAIGFVLDGSIVHDNYGSFLRELKATMILALKNSGSSAISYYVFNCQKRRSGPFDSPFVEFCSESLRGSEYHIIARVPKIEDVDLESYGLKLIDGVAVAWPKKVHNADHISEMVFKAIQFSVSIPCPVSTNCDAWFASKLSGFALVIEPSNDVRVSHDTKTRLFGRSDIISYSLNGRTIGSLVRKLPRFGSCKPMKLASIGYQHHLDCLRLGRECSPQKVIDR